MRGRASVGRRESAGDETCPCGGGRGWVRDLTPTAFGTSPKYDKRILARFRKAQFAAKTPLQFWLHLWGGRQGKRTPLKKALG